MNELTGALPAHLMADKAEAPAVKNQLGKDDFMKLLLTQMKYQDPLNPMDHKEMSAQLAQFSSLEQLSNIGSGIKNLRSGMGDDAKLQAVGLIGRQIKVAGNEVDLVEGQPVSLKIDPNPDIEPVKAVISDVSGKQIREIALTKKDVGEIKWDGKTTDGVDAPAGKYSFRVQGTDQHGQGREMTSEMSGQVTGLDMSGLSPMLLVQTPSGQSRVELSKVKNITMMEQPRPVAPSPQMVQGQKIAAAPQIQMPPAEGDAVPVSDDDGGSPPPPQGHSFRGMQDAGSVADRFNRYQNMDRKP